MSCIISPSRNFIYIHIPKTGGTSFSTILQRQMHKDDVVVSGHLRLRDISRKRDISGRLCIATIRNPFDRIVSFWTQRGKGLSFGEYVEMVTDGGEKWHYAVPQTSWLESNIIPAGALIFLRYERFEHYVMYFLGAFGYKMPDSIPWLRRTKGREVDYRQYYTAKERRKVTNLYSKDLKILGYKF